MDVHELAQNVNERVERRIGDCAEFGEGGGDVAVDRRFGVRVDIADRAAPMERPCWLRLADEAPEPEVVVGVVSSRIVGSICGLTGHHRLLDLDEIAQIPFPELAGPGRGQLKALVRRRRRSGDPQRRRLDWAVERVVVEAFDIPLSGLVALQKRWRES